MSYAAKGGNQEASPEILNVSDFRVDMDQSCNYDQSGHDAKEMVQKERKGSTELKEAHYQALDYELMKNLRRLRVNGEKTRQVFKSEGKSPLYYQTLRLYNERIKYDQEEKAANGGLRFISEDNDETDQPTDTYKALKFVGIGGQTGKEDIWDQSILHQLKAISPSGIKLAVCICMYQEDFSQFEFTM